MSHRYIEDHLIKDHLHRLDKAVEIYMRAREENDYSMISFALGMMASLAQLVYTRNDQLDLEQSKEVDL